MINTIQKPHSLILTIDDDDMIRLMLRDILSRVSFEILGAANGQTGLEMLIKLARSRLKMSSNLSFSVILYKNISTAGVATT